MDIKNKNILLLGAGASGSAAARLARAQGANCSLLDEKASECLQDLQENLTKDGIACRFGWTAEQQPPPADLIVISPGIKPDSTLGRLALRSTVPVLGELAFAAAFCPWPLLAVTGTNGKTTTVELLTHCLQLAGLRVQAAGNIGLPLSQVVNQPGNWDFVVAEVSSFQLEAAAGFQPVVAALLNVTPDHLDRHGSMSKYLDLKLQLLRQVPPAGSVVIKAELLALPQVKDAIKGKKIVSFTTQAKTAADFFLQDSTLCQCQAGRVRTLFATAALLLKGRHNYENALAVLAMMAAAGLDPETAAAGLGSFSSGKNRLEMVGTWSGVTYINDSKATNAAALCQALETCASPGKRSIILLAGGVDKGCSLEEVLTPLAKYVKKAFLFGECRQQLADVWQAAAPVAVCKDLESAVADASALAQQGDTVLLAPGCASFDMFSDYVHRGQTFIKIVKRRQRE